MQTDVSFFIFAFLLRLLIPLLFIGIVYLLVVIIMDNSIPTGGPTKAALIKTLYLYLVSFVALMMIVISAVDLLSTGLKTFIFTHADEDYYNSYPCPVAAPVADTSTPPLPPANCQRAEDQKQNELRRRSQRERDLVRDISLLVVAAPLFIYHWRLARRKEA